tara:strand:- start:961 stop:1377 length:417 start_codon:yes stop_codon:yes gene_type:complete
MKKSVQILCIYFLINFNAVSASQQINLITLNDINLIFSTNLKKWNENTIFLDKKESMEKIQLENTDNYSLKTKFKNGYVLITPIFRDMSVESITLIYNFKDMDKNKLDFIMNHFNSLNELCNKIDNNKNDVIIDIKKC